MARIVWAPKALDDLDSLLTYIARDAPLAARRFAQQLLGRVEMLGHHPLLGSLLPEDQHRTYRELRQGNYRLIYRIEADTVYIVAVHHAARLLDAGQLG
jgi:toxin ParE1/3/4